MIVKAVFLTALLSASIGSAAPPDRSLDAAASFETMKTMVGNWKPADPTTSSLRIRFSLTAGGTVLVEQWLRGEQPHSLTLYHRDGAGLIATHYCPQGNQPRLKQLAETSLETVRFHFLDATDLDPAKEEYLTDLAFDFSDKAMIVRRETYRQNGVDAQSTLTLVRD